MPSQPLCSKATVHLTTPPLSHQFSHHVAHGQSGKSAEWVIRSLFPYLDALIWQDFVIANTVVIDGKVSDLSEVVETGQRLDFSIENYQEDEVDSNWKLLWEGQEIIAVHKPPTLPVSRTTRNVYNNLVQLVRRQSPWGDAHLLHRLDLDTSGIVLMAKTGEFASKWQPQLRQLMEQKVYHAIVHGSPNWQTRELLCDLNTRSDSLIRCQMHICLPGEKGKFSHTRFKVLKRSENFSLIKCQLITGRKHQIRAHLAHLDHPIVGDKIYSNNGDYYLKRLQDAVTEADKTQLGSDHHLLLAQQVTLRLDAQQTVTISTPHRSKSWQTLWQQQFKS
ncbi:RluA family pseudouridine synthase [Ferrimonas aestuarii]|nr:RluA family pseudouridine synthase [Ferrimonas aestuarii]